MSKDLIIVESPAKAKTIQKLVGKEFAVISSKGHVRDLPSKDIGIDIAKGFSPKYEILPDKKPLIADIKKMVQEADVVWLATDDDREGEAISWHLIEAAKIPEEKIKRIVFHEITKTAIENALANPRQVDLNLVDAQQARRVLDRLVGFELSPVLWRKVKPSLSAGRVQSVAVRLIVERDREINNFVTHFSYRTIGSFISQDKEVKELEGELDKNFKTKEEVVDFLNSCKTATFKIESVNKSPGKRSPAPPFTTSTLQQEASRKLGFSVSKTMVIAQQLYEAGFITYMRTDSVNLSSLAINTIKDEVTTLYGEKYSKVRKYTTKAKGAQEAHEAIRPTFISKHTIPGDTFAKKLYDLIWKRTIASQMSDAQIEKTTINTTISNRSEKFVTTGEEILFSGFLKVYIESKDEEEEEVKGWLPSFTAGDVMSMKEIVSTQRYAQPPSRYSEASLVKKMEELGIGRPSTYAPTISTILKREYVVKESRPGSVRTIEKIILKDDTIKEEEKKEKFGNEKDKLFPTDVGIVVNEYLQEHFDTIMDYNFTANVEKSFDDIAEGEVEWQTMIADFYDEFHPSVEKALAYSPKASGERFLGVDPKSNEKVYAKLGKYGPMVQIGENYEDGQPRYARLKKTQSIEYITLEEALDLFKLPRSLGEYNGSEIVVKIGRFGPYLSYDGSFISIPKTEDPLEITLERSIELIEEKKQLDIERAPRLLGKHKEEDIFVIVGRYGPYLKYAGKNITLPKGVNPATLTMEEAIDILENGHNKNVLREFSENANLKVMNGRYGAYLTNGKDNYKIPKDRVAENLTYEECLEIISTTSPTNKKRTFKKSTKKK
ncbi:MAG TPA: type I DNA topoisomerase [Bacteroidales bacterium]|jgi:DNA topoisomerase-1|nr:type I DNA topoisomerase [Bacteroidales bacterium]